MGDYVETRLDLNQMVKGRMVELRPVGASDYEYLYDLETSTTHARAWRFGSGTVAPETYPSLLWHGAVANLLVVSAEGPNRRRLGLATIYGADPGNQTASFAVIGSPEVHRTGRLLEASALLIQHAFRSWGYRKMYAEILEPNLEQFASAIGNFCEIEGRLRAHVLVDGRFVDRITVAFYREVWAEVWESYSRTEAGLDGADSLIWENRSDDDRMALFHGALDRWGFLRHVDSSSEGPATFALDAVAQARLGLCLGQLTGRAVPDDLLPEIRTSADAASFALGSHMVTTFERYLASFGARSGSIV